MFYREQGLKAKKGGVWSTQTRDPQMVIVILNDLNQ